MASVEEASKEHHVLSQLERVRKEIRLKFTTVHQLLQARESVLLAELQEIEDRYRGQGIADEIKQLSLSKDQLENTLKGNQSKEILQQSIALMDQKIAELKNLRETAKELENVDLEWNLDFEDKLNALGAIRVNAEKNSSNLAYDYKRKGNPSFSFGKHSATRSQVPGIVAYPEGVTLDPQKNYLYICDAGNDRVQVFKSFQFLSTFSEKMKGPYGICTIQDKIYVTQSRDNCLNIYSHEHRLLRSIGKKGSGELEFNNPRGVAVSTEWERIYICEFDNGRVQCLNLDLSFNSFISDNFGAKDVKLTTQDVVVLCFSNPCVRIYNSSHQLSRQMITQGEGATDQLKIPSHFHLDPNLNILLTDSGLHSVFIFSFAGELIHKFGKEGEKKGDFIQPTGITLDSEGRIVVASYNNPQDCIQVF